MENTLLAALGRPGAADRPVLASADKQLTLAQFIDACDELETLLRQERVEVLALHADNGPSWVVADAVSQRMNLCLVPLPTFFSPLQLRAVLGQCQADLLLTDDPDALQALVVGRVGPQHAATGLHLCRVDIDRQVTPRIPRGTGKITFTSGSTGEAKGVCLANAQLLREARALVDVVAIEAPRHLCLLPLSTLLENVAGVYAPLLAGGEVVIPSLQEMGYLGSRLVAPEKMLAMISRMAPETVILIPELLKLLVAAARTGWPVPDSFRFIAVGGSKVGGALLEEAWSLGLPVFEGYGLSECASVVSLNTRTHNRHGSCGKLLPHVSVDTRGGEIVVRGNAMLGYLNRPESWYQDAIHTGDLGALDDDGFLHLSGRKKHILISSYGRNISPEWPESELLANPLLQDVVVFGDARPWCVALVSARDPALEDAAIGHWIDKVNAGLPDYAQVKSWLRLEQPLAALPGMLTANGRPRRAAIARHFADRIDALYARDEAGGGGGPGRQDAGNGQEGQGRHNRQDLQDGQEARVVDAGREVSL